MSAPLSIALCGAHGRMGQAVRASAERDASAFCVTAEISRGADVTAATRGAAVIVDFSLPAATVDVLAAARANRLPLVLGTTGHDNATREAITATARETAIVFAANFSVGVNTLFWLTRHATKILGPSFDPEIVELHHRGKKDAPSGTARRLAEIIAVERAVDFATAARHGRAGVVGERTDAEIGVHAVRGGDIVGEHTVFLAGIGERLELTHRATSRETFAAGALRAAQWLQGRPPGLYDMEDVLGLRDL